MLSPLDLKNKMMVIGVPIKYQGGIVGASFYVTGIFDIRKTTTCL